MRDYAWWSTEEKAGRSVTVYFSLVVIPILLVFFEVLVAVGAKVTPLVDRDDEVLPGNICRKNKFVICLLDQVEDLVFIEFALDDQGTVHDGRGEVKLDAAEAVPGFEDQISLRVGGAVLSLEAHVVHTMSLLKPPRGSRARVR